MDDKLELLLERGLIVKINGLATRLLADISVDVPDSILDKHKILEVDDASADPALS